MLSRRESNVVTSRFHDGFTVGINVSFARINADNELPSLCQYGLHADQQQDNRGEEEAELANTHVSSLHLDLVRLLGIQIPCNRLADCITLQRISKKKYAHLHLIEPVCHDKLPVHDEPSAGMAISLAGWRPCPVTGGHHSNSTRVRRTENSA